MLIFPDTLNATHWICLEGFEHNLFIHGFRPNWLSLIAEILPIRVKFFEPSCSTFHTTNFPGCFLTIMAQFESSRRDYVVHSSVQLLNYMLSKAMRKMSVHQLPQYYQPQQVPFMAWTAWVMWYTSCKLGYIKILMGLIFYLFY